MTWWGGDILLALVLLYDLVLALTHRHTISWSVERLEKLYWPFRIVVAGLLLLLLVHWEFSWPG